jgi:ribosomal-protein-alanine N-acetyltransferase
MGIAARPLARSVTRMPVVIRDATVEDIDAIAAIESVSFSDPWSRELLYTHVLSDVHTMLVADVDATVQGYAIAQVVVDESELLDIAVDPAARNIGVGATLLGALMARCRARGAVCMVLDVREGNHAARTIYDRFGFTLVGRRKHYYDHPREDALLMRAELTPSLPSPHAAN